MMLDIAPIIFIQSNSTHCNIRRFDIHPDFLIMNVHKNVFDIMYLFYLTT